MGARRVLEADAMQDGKLVLVQNFFIGAM